MMPHLLLTLLLFFFTKQTIAYLIPNPPGKYNVSLTTGPLFDYTRTNSPTDAMPRELMVSVFQPAVCTSTEPAIYMLNETAQYQGLYFEKDFNISIDLSPLFFEARVPVCSSPCFEADFPILLFSPGYTISRLTYNVLASAIASEGFVVITIDHPGDANIITYPDGHAVFGYNITDTIPTIKEHLAVRVMDVSFVIDQLSNATAMAELLPQRGRRPFPTDRIAMLGHSLGGATAVSAAGQDSRLRGAINWDGTFYNPLPSSGVSQPVLLMAHGTADDTWSEAWPRLQGPKLWVTIANATHETFSDVPTLLQVSGANSSPFTSLLGTIAPAEMVRILTAYTTAWMNGAFAGNEGGPLLEGHESGRFPELDIVMKGNF